MAVPADLLTQVSIGAVALYTLVTAASRAIDRLLALAEYYGIDEVLVGVTVLAVGTSLPELGAHLVASLGILSGTLDYQVASAVVLGGNMGSSTVQQLLLVGVLLVGYGTLPVTPGFLRDRYLPMLAGFGLTLAVAWDGTVGRLDGIVLLLAYVAYVGVSLRQRERAPPLQEAPSTDPQRDAMVAGGLLVLVLLSASLLLAIVQSALSLLALGGSTVGVVTLGVAAALPELTAVGDAVRRRSPNVALGTLIGSNIVNPLLGIGLGGAISTYYVPPVVVQWDLPFKLLAGVGLLAWVRWYRHDTLTRRDGGYLLGLYFVFVAGRLLLFPAQ